MKRVFLGLLIFMVSGCGNDAELDTSAAFAGCAAASIGSCTTSSGCIDYTGIKWTQAQLQAGCTGQDTTYSTAACPQASISGACHNSGSGVGFETITRYYSPQTPSGAALNACIASGGKICN